MSFIKQERLVDFKEWCDPNEPLNDALRWQIEELFVWPGPIPPERALAEQAERELPWVKSLPTLDVLVSPQRRTSQIDVAVAQQPSLAPIDVSVVREPVREHTPAVFPRESVNIADILAESGLEPRTYVTGEKIQVGRVVAYGVYPVPATTIEEHFRTKVPLPRQMEQALVDDLQEQKARRREMQEVMSPSEATSTSQRKQSVLSTAFAPLAVLGRWWMYDPVLVLVNDPHFSKLNKMLAEGVAAGLRGENFLSRAELFSSSDRRERWLQVGSKIKLTATVWELLFGRLEVVEALEKLSAREVLFLVKALDAFTRGLNQAGFDKRISMAGPDDLRKVFNDLVRGTGFPRLREDISNIRRSLRA